MLRLVSPNSWVLSLSKSGKSKIKARSADWGSYSMSFAGWEWLKLIHGEHTWELEFKVFLMVPKLWARSFSSEKELLPVFPQQEARTYPKQEQRSRGPEHLRQSLWPKECPMWELKTTRSSALLLPGTQWAWGERVGYPRGLTGDQQSLLNPSSSGINLHVPHWIRRSQRQAQNTKDLALCALRSSASMPSVLSCVTQ